MHNKVKQIISMTFPMLIFMKWQFRSKIIRYYITLSDHFEFLTRILQFLHYVFQNVWYMSQLYDFWFSKL